MSENNKSPAVLWFCFFLILLAALSRLMPHPDNFAPIAALGLFSGACLQTPKFWLMPVLALLLSDALIGFYHPVTMLSVYCGFILCAVLGQSLLGRQRTLLMVGGTTLAGSVIFFLLSNLGDWLSGVNYPLTWQGLRDCYLMAVPFFRNTLAGDLFYVAVLFGSYEMMGRLTWERHAARGA